MAISKLKSLFSDNLRKKEVNNGQENGYQIDKPSQVRYEDWGFQKASHLNGSHMGLLSCLARIREDHKRLVRQDEIKQKKLKEPFVIALKSNTAEIEQKETEHTQVKEQKVPDLQDKINSLKNDIISIKKNPEQIMPDKMSKVSFVIGLLILLALSVYLFIFYSSASFSAFFKEFSLNEIGIANSIFDPKAITKALQDGVTELILILTMPFIFFGLGFLIHKFQEEKGYGKIVKIGTLILVTFLFDAILAYEITEKIYNIKADNSFQELPPYSISLALEQINFWLIIFAGFVVYIIWGFVLDMTIASYDKLNVVKQAIKAKEAEIAIFENQIKGLTYKLDQLTNSMNELKRKCEGLKEKIDGVIIDTAEFDKILHEFLGGWLHWMTANKKPQNEIDQAKIKADEFIAINVRTLEIQNT